MKNLRISRLVAAALLLSILAATLPGCATPASAYTYDISFKVGNEYLPTVTVRGGELLEPPLPPERENHVFTGWYTDAACTKRFDPDAPINSSLTLFAGYELDEAGLVNTITTRTMRALVTVYAKSYTKPEWWELWESESSVTSQGSGSIVKITDEGRCYVLTNCHVAVKDPDYENMEYTVEDFRGNTYRAALHREPVTGVDSIDPEYDLALLYFDCDDAGLLEVMKLAAADPLREAQVVSLGSPKGQSNSMTFGRVSEYRTVTLDGSDSYESCVSFPVISHTAYINDGSSGGPLLNGDLELVGVNYAGDLSGEYAFHRGYAIPIERVWEFLRGTCIVI